VTNTLAEFSNVTTSLPTGTGLAERKLSESWTKVLSSIPDAEDKSADESSRVRVYSNGRVEASAEMLRKLSNFSERQIRKGTGIRRDTIRAFRHGEHVTNKIYRKIFEFLKEQENAHEERDKLNL